LGKNDHDSSMSKPYPSSALATVELLSGVKPIDGKVNRKGWKRTTTVDLVRIMWVASRTETHRGCVNKREDTGPDDVKHGAVSNLHDGRTHHSLGYFGMAYGDE
jgi:hypothetical protein